MNAVRGTRREILQTIADRPNISTRELVSRHWINAEHHLSGLAIRGFIKKSFHATKKGGHRWEITAKSKTLLEVRKR